MLHYVVTPIPNRHEWHISLTFRLPENRAQSLKLANWTPGSYMIRDFSRHLVSINASCNGTPIQLTQTAKNEWQTPPKSGDYQIDYIIYGNDLSVRSSYLDHERGFFDGACMFLYLPEYRQATHHLRLEKLPENWQIATTLPSARETGSFQAAAYDALIDHPVELGAAIEILEFTACDIPHRIAISGRYRDFDRARLVEDCRRVCTEILQTFPEPAPFDHYLFMLYVGDGIYGGLEHISSTALHTDRNALPQHGSAHNAAAYTQLIGLFSHEYFHSWNVKSIKPAAFVPYHLDQEAYTEQLWAFEGITSYYDDLMLVRSGVISAENYLNLLAQTMTRVYQTPGVQRQTLAESSFTAWNKYYKQDENSPNAITSYYQKGSLMALYLDLLIRSRSRHSLDSVMQQLYRDWQQSRQGIEEQQWQRRAEEITGLDLSAFFQAALYSTEPLPLASCLRSAGIELRWLPDSRTASGGLVAEFPEIQPAPDLGCRAKAQDGTALLTHVFNGSAAEAAGLMPQDKIIAIDGYACADFAGQTATAVGDRHTLHYFRQGVLRQTELTVQAAAEHTAYLKITDPAALQRWLYAA